MTEVGIPNSRHGIVRFWLVFLIVLLVATTIGLREYADQSGHLSNDSTQYLVGAISVLNDVEYSTRILYFDEHYAPGEIPVPQTVWPPGLSVTIAGLASLGVPPEDSGRIVSLLGYVALALFTGLAVWILTKSAAAMLMASIWFLSISQIWQLSVSILSDMAFATTITAAVLLYVAQSHPRGHPDQMTGIPFRALTWISLIAGISFLYRYAGIFLIFWTILLIGSECVYRIRSRNDAFGLLIAKSLGAALPSVVIFLSVVGRNFDLTGSIRGGNNMLVPSPISDAIFDAAKVIVTLLTGIHRTHFLEDSWVSTGAGVLSLAVLIAIGLSFLLWFRNRFFALGKNRWHEVKSVMIVVLIIIYVGGIAIISSRTAVPISARYVFPILPVIVILGISHWSFGRSSMIAGIATISIIQMLVSSGINNSPKHPSRNHYTEISEWTKRNTSTEEPIVIIGDSQRIGYYSNRPTLGVPEQEFTRHVWNFSRITNVASQYGARYIIASKTEHSSDFNAESLLLMTGHTPNWLTLEANLDAAYVYRIAEDD